MRERLARWRYRLHGKVGLGRSKRARFSPVLRWELGAAQRWRCATCSAALPVTAEIDHNIPLFAGGPNDRWNLQLLCPNCHAEKSRAERQSRLR